MSNEPMVGRKDEYVIIKARGKRKNFKAIIEGTNFFYDAAKKFDVNYFIADYRDIIYEVPMTDALNMVKIYDHMIPDFSRFAIGVVTNYASIEFGRTWEDLC